ncbi:MAG TPA: hypothetical protein VL049_09260 [Candidatus Dormibacteraeota bacterium]|nr:hypothetical protein [Candidatus Dormibacteraeota bacterium]
MSRAAVLLVALVALGCGRGSFTLQPNGPERVDYSPAERVRVMLPAAGSQGDEGGRIIAGRVVQVLQQTHADVQLVASADLSAALAEARTAKAVHLIQPTVTEWTEGLAPPFTADQLGVRLELIDVASGAVVNTVTYTNASSLFAVSDTPPSSLLDARFDDAVRALIGSARR